MATNQPLVIPQDLVVRGNLTASAFTFPTGGISDTHIASGANIAATKLNHDHRPSYSQGSTTTAATATTTIYQAVAAGTVNAFYAGLVVACIGAATVTIDLKKNGTSILSSVITLNSSQTARQIVAAAINPALNTFVAGDWFEVVITATAGGGTLGTGLALAAQMFEASF